MGLIIPGNTNDAQAAAKALNDMKNPNPSTLQQPQQIPIDQFVIQVSAQIAQQAFQELIKPYEARIKELEDKVKNQSMEDENKEDE